MATKQKLSQLQALLDEAKIEIDLDSHRQQDVAREKLENQQAAAVIKSISSLQTSVLQISETIKAQQESSNEISTSLADLVAAIEGRPEISLTEVVVALKAIKMTAPAIHIAASEVSAPAVHNHVPQPLVQILERTKPVAYRLHDITHNRHGEITGALLSPVLGDAGVSN